MKNDTYYESIETKMYKIMTSLKEGVHLKSSKERKEELAKLGFNVGVDVRIGMLYTLECEPNKVEAIAKALISPLMEDYFILEVKPEFDTLLDEVAYVNVDKQYKLEEKSSKRLTV
jgi:phosphoribosylformylglycinamidine (FGAM) synthase PurS component